MERAEEIFSLFEGQCPDCGIATRVMGAGGKKQFFVMQPWVGNIDGPVGIWAEDAREGSGIVGSVDFECENGHKYTIEYGRWGEWL